MLPPVELIPIKAAQPVLANSSPMIGRVLACVSCLLLSTATRADEPSASAGRGGQDGSESALAAEILADPDLPRVLEMARALLRTGLNAGSGYGETWIRDFNTFIELALEVNPVREIRSARLQFFRFQGENGDVPDGYVPVDRATAGYRYRRSPLAPGLLAHKNTVETDQETSLVQAVRKYVTATGDRSILREEVAGECILDRMCRALRYVIVERGDAASGLVWGATTADWGDVQPEHRWGVELDARSHRAIDIYDNAMLAIAIADLLHLLEPGAAQQAEWEGRLADLKRNIRRHLWDPDRRKFTPHLYLEGSPFPEGFAEAEVFYHGGTTIAIEAGLLERDEVVYALDAMKANVRRAGAASIGLTLHPPYPRGFFENPAMVPGSYQNGGDWCWFGGRMVRQLIARGMVREAYAELKPMITRVREHGDFYEWWSLDNQPRGSRQFRGSAGVLGVAIQDLLAWARRNASEDRIRKDSHE